ncbi:MAG TPA: class I SAM-dependent methyltransferase [Gemmatimonadaceae bacterium]|nr:class I SAM-dependent methyltransferase [Gemmatimonadaceae bacterium]
MTISYEPAHCVVCGHTDARIIATQDDLRAEVEALWEFHQARLRPETPPERLLDRVAFSQHPPLAVVQCRECGLVYRNPVERQHELTEIYARTTPAPDVLRALHDTQLPAIRVQAHELRRVLGRGGSGLEVGSYVGAFLSAARDEGMNVEGLDINPEVNAFTRSLGFDVHDGTLMTFTNDHRYDAVAIWNTFDQLPEPRAAVIAAARLLSDGGVLALRVPNGEFYARVRPRLRSRSKAVRRTARALLAQNNLLTFPYRAGFGVRSLTRLLGDAGLRVVRVRGDVLVPVGDEWTRAWARREESIVKRVMGLAASASTAWAPWIEVYAIRGER